MTCCGDESKYASIGLLDGSNDINAHSSSTPNLHINSPATSPSEYLCFNDDEDDEDARITSAQYDRSSDGGRNAYCVHVGWPQWHKKIFWLLVKTSPAYIGATRRA